MVKKAEIIMLIFALLISVILHFPLVPHEMGWDSFYIHRAADSIIYYHQIKWLVNPLSFVGYYPYSYPSGVITLLAELSSLAGIDMEHTILLFTFLEGILAVLYSFYLGKKLFPIGNGKWIFVFLSALSPGLLYFTLWTVSTRGFISILFVLLIYLILETKGFFHSTKSKKFALLTLIFLFISPTIHRLWIFIIPFIVIFLIVRVIITKWNIHKNLKYSIILVLAFVLVISVFLLLSFFYSKTFNYFVHYNIYEPYTYYLMGLHYGRLNGPLIFILPLGLFYAIKEKRENIFYILLFAIMLLPLYYISSYTAVISYVVFPIFISYGILKLSLFLKEKRKHGNNYGKKVSTLAVISLITINIIFAGIVQYYHPNITGRERYGETYMEEGTYNAGIWLKHSYHPERRDTIIVNYNPERFVSISQDQSISDRDVFELINNFTTMKDGDIIINKKLWTWPDIGPFVLKHPYVTAYSYWYPLVYHSPSDKFSKNVQVKFNVSIVAEDIDVAGYQQWAPSFGIPIKKSIFYQKIGYVSYKIFENDKFRIYYW